MLPRPHFTKRNFVWNSQQEKVVFPVKFIKLILRISWNFIFSHFIFQPSLILYASLKFSIHLGPVRLLIESENLISKKQKSKPIAKRTALFKCYSLVYFKNSNNNNNNKKCCIFVHGWRATKHNKIHNNNIMLFKVKIRKWFAIKEISMQ